ncbi:hypothetical protein DXT94_28350 [Rhizobium sp. ICMP 5592]|nr:hypothetical protein [Rhizobium sp. ICMP 5592]
MIPCLAVSCIFPAVHFGTLGFSALPFLAITVALLCVEIPAVAGATLIHVVIAHTACQKRRR